MYAIKPNWGINIRLKLYFAVFLRLLHNIFAIRISFAHVFPPNLIHEQPYVLLLWKYFPKNCFFFCFYKFIAKFSWANLNTFRLHFTSSPNLQHPERKWHKSGCKYKQRSMLSPKSYVLGSPVFWLLEDEDVGIR